MVNDIFGGQEGDRENEYTHTYTSNMNVTGISEQGSQNNGREQIVQDIIQESFPEINY